MITRLNYLTLTLILFFNSALIGVAAPFFHQEGNGYEPHSGQSIFDLIHQEEEVVNMTLIGEMDSFIHIRKTRDYSKADLTYIDGTGVERKYQVKVKPRGKFRRRVCDFPPLKLKFSKDELEAAGLSKHNDLKLVTHCMEDKEYNESLILKEYLTYKMYNELTPNSFRVQLVNITYQDRNDPTNSINQYGFLIEDVDEMADRMGGKECDDCIGLSLDKVKMNHERLMSMFQYMIGNLDYSIEMNRNVKMIEMEKDVFIPVPYDFDFSVLIGAPYLKPNIEVGQTVDMERIFTGHAKEADELYSTMAYFKTKKKALIEIIREFEYLSKAERFEMIGYLRGFFNQLVSSDRDEAIHFGEKNVDTK